MTATKININDFRSPLESLMAPEKREDYAAKRRAEGAKLAPTHVMHVAGNGVWSARHKNGHVDSYEKIGYHTCAEQLLQGFLEAGGKCLFHNFRGIDGEVSL